MRVFVSSTLEELAPERRAAAAAVTGLHLTPVMFELGARPHPPRELYRAYLEQSDVFVGIYWQRYGWVAPGETVSGLEDEYALSGDRPKLIYVKAPAPDREDSLDALLQRIRSDDRVSYKPFHDAAELGRLLADDLAVLLTERFTSRRERTPGLKPARLPTPLTSMVGRDADREALVARLRGGARLVTVTGPGGIGKTRLALDVAARLAEDVFDGAWLVDLTPVSDATGVPAAIAAALGVRAPGRRPVLDVLADQLSGRRILLVADNFEHVVSAAGDVARLLTVVAELSVLATSRTVLHVRGEEEWPLAPLAVPGAGAGAGPVASSPAVQLFLARAAESRPGFSLTDENAPVLAEICRRLEGNPLAIELAAAWVRLLSPQALLERLGSRLDLSDGHIDRPDRQRTLRATLDWSYRLLEPQERALLARLSVFAGAWTIEAAESLGADDAQVRAGDILTGLSALVDKSLVTVDESASAEPRLRMSGVVREYAAERLEERGERRLTVDRLVDLVISLLEDASRGFRTTYRAWEARLDGEMDNIRAAWRHAVDADEAPKAYRIGLPLAYHSWSRSLLPEVLALLDQIAGLPSASRLDAAARGRLLWGRGALRIETGHLDDPRPMLDEALRVGHELGDSDLIIRATAGLSYLADVEDVPQMRTALREAATRLRREGDLADAAYTLAALGQLVLRSGDADGAGDTFEECLRIAEQTDNEHLRTIALHQLAFAALISGKPARARELLEASVATNVNLLDQEGLSYCLDGFAAIAVAFGHETAAARLLGAGAHLRTVLGVTPWRAVAPFLADTATRARTALGDERYETERAKGSRLQPIEALTYAGRVVRPR